MPQSNVPVSLAAGGGAIRLLGALKATTAIAASNSPEELINVAGYGAISVRGKFSSVTITPTLNIHPMTVDGITRLTTGAPTAVDITGNGEFLIEYTLKGELFVEIEVDVGGGEAATVDFIEVFGKIQ